MQDSSHPTFAGLLRSAVEEPGTLSSAYHAFHAYSLGNQLLAMFQCHERGLKPGPMATFPRWKELGRHVRRGQKALTLCMPLTLKQRTGPAGHPLPPGAYVFGNAVGEPLPDSALPRRQLRKLS